MAYTSIENYIKKFSTPPKRSDAALQTYSTADSRAWAANKFERSILIRDIITRPSSQHQTGDVDLSGVSKNECIKKMAELQSELDKMHELYKEASEKIESLENAALESQKSQIILRDSQVKLKAQNDIINDLKNGNSEEYKKLLKERDALRAQLKNAEDLEELLKKFKARADEADAMEQEIDGLKRNLEKCHQPTASGDKIKVNTGSCNNCQSCFEEMERLKQRIDLEEKRSTESMAERNFLRQRTRTIDLLEAELILFKNKYEECECKIRALKEVICKNDSAERISQQSRCRVNDMERRLQETECENDNLISIIERLNANLDERDLYINSLTKRLNEDCGIEVINPVSKKTISCESIASGTVESIVKKISACGNTSACRCNVSNCKCGQISGCPSSISKPFNCAKHIAMKKCLKKTLSKCKAGENEMTRSRIDGMQIDKLLDEVRLLRGQNCELEKELNRVKHDLVQMTVVVDEVEKHRKSNEELEGKLEEIRSSFNANIGQMSSKYEASVADKICELNQLEKRLKCEVGKAQELEKKVCELCEELSHLKEYREKCEALQKSLNCTKNDHYEKSRDAELFKRDCQAYFEENQRLKCEIEKLKCEIEALCVKHCQSSAHQRDAIKKSVVEFKRHYDEKLQMIKCYEEKIRHLENENEILKCSVLSRGDKFEGNDILKKAAKFSLASLENEELVVLHERIRRAMMKPANLEIHCEYSKLLDEICHQKKFNSELPVHDDYDDDDDTCSTRTAPVRSRALKKSYLKPIRSKSSDLCKPFSQKRKRKQSR